MSLATVIRLEFAYPGVGVLAGDSLQYLSVATAHGVIMVFYMIMPAIFGAFGNFLLPTQLGVHDVAFPRLNSAAFWFLPGGLIMLCQLVCTDRRYARMNCFNIRELQGILKRKFFVDLTNSHDHRVIFDESIIGMRFKINSTKNLDFDYFNFYTFGINNGFFGGVVDYEGYYLEKRNIVFLNDFDYYFLNLLGERSPLNYLTPNPAGEGGDYFIIKFYNIILDFFTVFNSLNFLSTLYMFSLGTLTNTMSFILTASLPTYYFWDVNPFQNKVESEGERFFFNKNTVSGGLLPELLFTESATEQRFNRFSNPLINYDYKTGNYIGN